MLIEPTRAPDWQLGRHSRPSTLASDEPACNIWLGGCSADCSNLGCEYQYQGGLSSVCLQHVTLCAIGEALGGSRVFRAERKRTLCNEEHTVLDFQATGSTSEPRDEYRLTATISFLVRILRVSSKWIGGVRFTFCPAGNACEERFR